MHTPYADARLTSAPACMGHQARLEGFLSAEPWILTPFNSTRRTTATHHSPVYASHARYLQAGTYVRDLYEAALNRILLRKNVQV